jgi:hypothetical protein
VTGERLFDDAQNGMSSSVISPAPAWTCSLVYCSVSIGVTAGFKGTEKDDVACNYLCDFVLQRKAKRHHRFDLLLGDPGKNGRCSKLPVTRTTKT